MKKQVKKLSLNKIKLVTLENANKMHGGENSGYCWTRPFNMCILSLKDLDCKPIDPIKVTVNGC